MASTLASGPSWLWVWMVSTFAGLRTTSQWAISPQSHLFVWPHLQDRTSSTLALFPEWWDYRSVQPYWILIMLMFKLWAAFRSSQDPINWDTYPTPAFFSLNMILEKNNLCDVWLPAEMKWRTEKVGNWWSYSPIRQSLICPENKKKKSPFPGNLSVGVTLVQILFRQPCW